MRSDPQTAAADWARGMQGASDKISRGIDRVSEAPGAKAARKVDKYRQGVLDNVDTWARRSAAVTLGDWQAAAKAGVSRVAEGASRKADKYASAVTPVFQHLSTVVAQVDNMPDNTLEERIAKSAALQRGMAAYRRAR